MRSLRKPRLLFTALPPADLRKAKKEFSAAFTHIIKLANSVQRIRLAEQTLAELDQAIS